VTDLEALTHRVRWTFFERQECYTRATLDLEHGRWLLYLACLDNGMDAESAAESAATLAHVADTPDGPRLRFHLVRRIDLES
jgi:hypothetical protein